MILLTLLAAAQVPTMDCRKPMSQYEMNGCAHRIFRSTDAALNTQWKKTLAAAHKAARQARSKNGPLAGIADALLSSQRGWIAYRDNHCRAVLLSVLGGSMGPKLEALCLAGLTRDRNAQLKDMEKRLQ